MQLSGVYISPSPVYCNPFIMKKCLTVQLGSQRIVDINSEDLPIGLTLIQESHDTEDLDLLDLTGSGNLLTDFNDINRIVITTSLGLRVRMVGIFPSLI